jgi:hypothetical protein
MISSSRRAAGAIVVLIFLSPGIGACSSTQHALFDNGAALNHATGVTTRSGTDVSFSKPGASISNDTLYAVGRQGQLVIPTDSIATVSRRKFSTIRTVGLMGGLFAGALLVAFIALASSDFNIGP